MFLWYTKRFFFFFFPFVTPEFTGKKIIIHVFPCEFECHKKINLRVPQKNLFACHLWHSCPGLLTLGIETLKVSKKTYAPRSPLKDNTLTFFSKSYQKPLCVNYARLAPVFTREKSYSVSRLVMALRKLVEEESLGRYNIHQELRNRLAGESRGIKTSPRVTLSLPLK